jgi:hypothetical protein
VATP